MKLAAGGFVNEQCFVLQFQFNPKYFIRKGNGTAQMQTIR